MSASWFETTPQTFQLTSLVFNREREEGTPSEGFGEEAVYFTARNYSQEDPSGEDTSSEGSIEQASPFDPDEFAEISSMAMRAFWRAAPPDPKYPKTFAGLG